MGKTSKPLRILVTRAEMLAWPEVVKMVEQQHQVSGPVYPGEPFDVILGPECWRMTEQHRPFWQVMVDSVRKWRYPKEKAE